MNKFDLYLLDNLPKKYLRIRNVTQQLWTFTTIWIGFCKNFQIDKFVITESWYLSCHCHLVPFRHQQLLRFFQRRICSRRCQRQWQRQRRWRWRRPRPRVPRSAASTDDRLVVVLKRLLLLLHERRRFKVNGASVSLHRNVTLRIFSSILATPLFCLPDLLASHFSTN